MSEFMRPPARVLTKSRSQAPRRISFQNFPNSQ
jgi:hypothetical protein